MHVKNLEYIQPSHLRSLDQTSSGIGVTTTRLYASEWNAWTFNTQQVIDDIRNSTISEKTAIIETHHKHVFCGGS